MRRLLHVLIGLVLMTGLFTGCEKPNENGEGAGGTATEKTGTIKGMVTDKETGSPLSEVTIGLQYTGKQTNTDKDGAYIIENLKVGTYALKAQKEGYVDYNQKEVQLVVDQTTILNIEMEKKEDYKAESDYIVNAFGLNMEMAYVEGGEFKMGATEEQRNEAEENEKPVRNIKLDGYHIGKTVVTQAQWKAVMGSEPSVFSGDNLPVVNVNWEDAQEFCKKLSEATGKQYKLPTEAQWEYAARGGNKSQQYKYAGSNNIYEVAWFRGNSANMAPVGTKKANEVGIYDMSGNVWEWCSDWYADRYDENDTDNPQGPVEGSKRVLRGGFWDNEAETCRVSTRFSHKPAVWYSFIGFRVACISE